MAENIEFSSLPQETQAILVRLSTLVAGVVPLETNTWKFATNTFQPNSNTPAIVFEVAQWETNLCIYLYTIHLVTEHCDLSQIRTAFSIAKAKKDSRAYPRLNGESRCLYVGSSEKVHQRLREHLGYGAKSTYALHLAYWASSFPIEIEFKCAKYKADHPRDVYQTLEDTLWDKLKPMFGRKGSR